MICIIILSVGSLFVLKSPTGEPWLSTSNFYDSQAISNNITQFKNTILDNVESLTSDQKAKVNQNSDANIYKWQDESGAFHYSDQGNSKDDAWVKPNNLTIMPAIEPLEPKSIDVVSNKKSSEKPVSNNINTSNVAELIADAKNVQNLLDNRKKEMDARLK